MRQVPFSVFADFVCTPSQDRYSIVDTFKTRGEYKVERDLYRLAKREIFNKALSGKPVSISSVLGKTNHQLKHDIYPPMLNNFEISLGQSIQISFNLVFPPPEVRRDRPKLYKLGALMATLLMPLDLL